jgi:hypothetical protein
LRRVEGSVGVVGGKLSMEVGVGMPVIDYELFILKSGEIAVVQARPIDFQERDMKPMQQG